MILSKAERRKVVQFFSLPNLSSRKNLGKDYDGSVERVSRDQLLCF
jgi:hypothetical protein